MHCESGALPANTFMAAPDTELTGDVLFLLFHLPLQVCQQCLALLVHSEADGAEVIAGGLQSQGVEGQEPSHSLAVRERAEENQGELNDRFAEPNQT